MFLKRSLVLLTALSLLLLAGCGSSSSPSSSQPAPAPSSSQPAPAAKPAEKVKIQFWHAMGGVNGEALQSLVDEFNKSQDKYEVQAVYQGTYDEALQKLKAAGPNGPAMIQVFEIGSRFMIDSGLATPVQKFIDADKLDMSDFEKNIVDYYKFDGKFYAMPFNTSTPIMYYNKTAFKEAGLDPNNPPRTWDDFHLAAQKLTKKDGSTTRYGAAIAWYGWFFEQWMAEQGADYVDNGNGRGAKATRSNVASPQGEGILKWLKSMVDDGSAANLGRKTADTQTAFSAGQVAMTLDSTAVLAQILKNVGGKFEVGTGYFPKPAGANGGVMIGGASLWILNIRPDAEQKAAWELAKFLTSPHSQAVWNVKTGYFPVRRSAYDDQMVKDNMAKYPQFQTAVEQLRASPDISATHGAVFGTFAAARQQIEGAMENTVLGKTTASEALKAAAAEIDKSIVQYNQTNK